VSEENWRFSERLSKAWVWAGSLLLALALLLLGLVQPGDMTEGAVKALTTPSPQPLGFWLAALLLMGLALCALMIFALRREERRYAKLADEKSDLEHQFRHAKAQLTHTEHLMVTDPITGIPNFRSWQKHAEAWPRTAGSWRLSCLILIDLDNLGWLNDKSHECANKVLELFASRSYRSMRRNEHAFKLPDRNSPVETSAQIEMFRHYAGGDEFFFHMSDDVFASIGFLNRLVDNCSKYEKEIKDTILPGFMTQAEVAQYKLQFSAAIVPVEPGVAPDDVTSSALKLLTYTKKRSDTRLLVQFSPGSGGRSLSERAVELELEAHNVGEAIAQIETDGETPQPKIDRLQQQRGSLIGSAQFLRKFAPTFERVRTAEPSTLTSKPA